MSCQFYFIYPSISQGAHLHHLSGLQNLTAEWTSVVLHFASLLECQNTTRGGETQRR